MSTKKLAVGFYNVGVHLEDIDGDLWRMKQRLLGQDIVKAFKHHDLDVLCLSALGQLNESLDDEFEGGTGTWIRGLISAEQPDMEDITIYADDHYVTIVKDSRVNVAYYETVRGFVPGQEERSFQLSRVLVTDTNQQVCIINCDAPASKTRGLSADGRMRYFKTFNDMSGADPFIWGGNLNTGVIQLAALLRTVDPGRRINTSFSHPRRYKHGDIALTCGLRAAQVNSEVGSFYDGASADHDLVVAKVSVPASVSM